MIYEFTTISDGQTRQFTLDRERLLSYSVDPDADHPMEEIIRLLEIDNDKFDHATVKLVGE
jgi:hypothetical protein